MVESSGITLIGKPSWQGNKMTEQNRNYIKREIGKLLSDIWRIKGLSEQECGQNHPITKKLIKMHHDAQALMQEK